MGEFKHHHIMNHKEKTATLWKNPAFFRDIFSFKTFWLFLPLVFPLYFWPHSSMQSFHISMARTTVVNGYCKWSHTLLLGQVSYCDLVP